MRTSCAGGGPGRAAPCSAPPRTRAGGPLTLLLLLTTALVVLLSGCASGDAEAPAPLPEPTPPTDVPPGGVDGVTGGELEAHLARCRQGVEEWKESAGQLDYPATLRLRVDQPSPYNAAVDISDAPLPPDEVITVPDGEATDEEIMVQCGIAARLVPVGDLSVAPDQSQWVTREFSPSGVAEWSWDVTTTSTGDKTLRLELQPAQLGNGAPLSLGTQTAHVFTDVVVDGTWIDHLAHWFDTQWPKLVAVVVALGIAVAGLSRWAPQHLGWLRRKSGARKEDPSTEADAATTPTEQEAEGTKD